MKKGSCEWGFLIGFVNQGIRGNNNFLKFEFV